MAEYTGGTVRVAGRRRTLERLVRRAREEDPLHVRQQVQRLLLVGGCGVVVELRRRVRRAAAALRMRSARRRRRRVRRATARSRPEGQLHQRNSARRLRRPPAVGGLRANLDGAWRPRAEGCDSWAAGERGPARLRRARGRRAEGPLAWGFPETPRPGMQIFEEARRQRLAGFALRRPWLEGPRWRYILACGLWLSWPLASRACSRKQAFFLQQGVLRPR